MPIVYDNYDYGPTVHATPNGHTRVVAIDTLRVQLLDATARPLPYVPFEVELPTGNTLAGRANRHGYAIVRQRVGAIEWCIVRWAHFGDKVHPSDARLWFAYERRVWLTIAPGDRGYRQRLHNLGYTSEVPFARSLMLFQRMNDLPITGDLTDNTRALIEAQHQGQQPIQRIGG